LGFIVVQAINGLASAASLFLIASGLTIIFGVTRVINFAHGSLYMVGAYAAWTLADFWVAGGGALGFWSAVLVAAAAVGALGLLMEILLLRRLYRAPELQQLLATFAVVLVVQDATRAVWGAEDLLGPRAPGLDGSLVILGRAVPEYELMLIAIGLAVLAGLWLLFRRTRFGMRVRAATEDREMVAALGVDQRRLFTAVFVLGATLAGLGGALQVPRQAASLSMDLGVIVEAFVVVVVGGMGSIGGAFIAAVLIGELNAFGILVFPEATLVLTFLIMAVALVLRPRGLFGPPEAVAGAPAPPAEAPLAAATGWRRAIWPAVAAVALALPALVGDYVLVLLTEIAALALFGASLRFIVWGGGLISFGHAAYFGLGAYGAALAVSHLGAPMSVALLAAPLAAAAGALLFGWFCVRLSGIYLAMLTLAFAQIAWSAAFQWVAATGGDNGILGVWPADWAAAPATYYGLTVVACGLAGWGLQHTLHAPFGACLRATRDAPARAAAIGIDVRRHRWFAFTVAGVAAGVAGGFFAFAKGSVFPDALAVGSSVDALVVMLLGGIASAAGPLLGALALTGIETEITRLTDQWQLALGALILALVLAAPGGLAGLGRAVPRSGARR
jgi:branched-chain amino acid transport system permease protein